MSKLAWQLGGGHKFCVAPGNPEGECLVILGQLSDLKHTNTSTYEQQSKKGFEVA